MMRFLAITAVLACLMSIAGCFKDPTAPALFQSYTTPVVFHPPTMVITPMPAGATPTPTATWVPIPTSTPTVGPTPVPSPSPTPMPTATP